MECVLITIKIVLLTLGLLVHDSDDEQGHKFRWRKSHEQRQEYAPDGRTHAEAVRDYYRAKKARKAECSREADYRVKDDEK